jgi:hypothetical protein
MATDIITAYTAYGTTQSLQRPSSVCAVCSKISTQRSTSVYLPSPWTGTCKFLMRDVKAFALSGSQADEGYVS